MRALILLLATCLTTGLCQGQSTPQDAQDMPPAQLTKLLGTPNNEEDMYAEAHVPGAKLIVYDQVTTDKLPADRDATLVFYCYSDQCPASHTAAHKAVELGYGRVYYMLAGITGWQDAGLPTEP
jgi:rhodanese-related sulfurtransferase